MLKLLSLSLHITTLQNLSEPLKGRARCCCKMRCLVLAGCVGAACAGGLRGEVRAQIMRFCIGECPSSDAGVSSTIQGVTICIPAATTVDASTGVVTLADAIIYKPGQKGNACPVMPVFPPDFVTPQMPTMPPGFPQMPTMPPGFPQMPTMPPGFPQMPTMPQWPTFTMPPTLTMPPTFSTPPMPIIPGADDMTEEENGDTPNQAIAAR